MFNAIKNALSKMKRYAGSLCGGPSDSPALRRLRQEDWEFKASLGYIVRPRLIKPREKKNDM
jgi:hypothetical protein